MKRIVTVTVLALFCATSAKAYVVEIGALTQTLLQLSRMERVLYYGQMVAQQIQAARNTYEQVQAAIRAEQRAFNNLRGITSVNSYAELMAWYNRQLDLERYTNHRFDSIRIRVGNTDHRLRDIEGIREGITTTYGRAYWEAEFTDDQRRDMWLELGLSPANFAYQNTWATREGELFERHMIRRGFLEDENQVTITGIADAVQEATADGAGDRQVAEAGLHIALDTNRLIREILMSELEWREFLIAQHRLANAPPEPLYLSGMWGQELFPRPIVPGRFVPFE